MKRSVLVAALATSGVSAQPDLRPHDFRPVPLRVVAVTPGRETIGFPRDGLVSVRFNQPVDAASLSASSLSVLGRWSGPVDGAFVLSDGGRTATWVPGRPFSAGEMVTISVSRGVRSIGGATLAGPFQEQFWVAAGPGSMVYDYVATLDPGITPYGAFGGDLDGDGDLDLAIPNEDSQDVSVFLNNGLDQFTTTGVYPVGNHCSPNEGLDFSGDGIVDIATANILSNNVSILIGNGDGTYRARVDYPVGSQPRGLAALDLEGDGDIDLVTANRASGTLSILRNNGDGTFGAAGTFAGSQFDGTLHTPLAPELQKMNSAHDADAMLPAAITTAVGRRIFRLPGAAPRRPAAAITAACTGPRCPPPRRSSSGPRPRRCPGRA